MESYLDEVKARIAQSVQFDASKYHLEYGGQYENEQRAQARLTLVLALVLGLMTLVAVSAEFGKLRSGLAGNPRHRTAWPPSWRTACSYYIRGETLNVATAVGFIALFGVAVQNGIIMVANLNRMRETGASLLEATIAGASERFRPVLTTATVATIGMLPAALATGVGSDVQRGVATVVIGGLIVATMLTLFILPTFYFVVESRVERRVAAGSREVV